MGKLSSNSQIIDEDVEVFVYIYSVNRALRIYPCKMNLHVFSVSALFTPSIRDLIKMDSSWGAQVGFIELCE